MNRLIIEGNSVYEIDENCMTQKKNKQKEEHHKFGNEKGVVLEYTKEKMIKKP